MKLAEDIRTVTDLKTRAAELIETVNETRRPLVVTQNGKARAVLVDVETYEALRDATVMLRLTQGGEADARAGRTVPQARVMERVRRRAKQSRQ